MHYIIQISSYCLHLSGDGRSHRTTCYKHIVILVIALPASLIHVYYSIAESVYTLHHASVVPMLLQFCFALLAWFTDVHFAKHAMIFIFTNFRQTPLAKYVVLSIESQTGVTTIGNLFQLFMCPTTRDFD